MGRACVLLSLVGTVWGCCKSPALHADFKPRLDLVNEQGLERPKRGFRGRSAVDPQTTKYVHVARGGSNWRDYAFRWVNIVQVHTWNVGGGRDPDQERRHTRLVPHRGVGDGGDGVRVLGRSYLLYFLLYYLFVHSVTGHPRWHDGGHPRTLVHITSHHRVGARQRLPRIYKKGPH